MFLAGSLYLLFQRHAIDNHALAGAAAVRLIICLFFQPVVALALVALGGYLIFSFARQSPVLPISRFTNKTGLSYGIYLYAWPTQSTIAFFADRSINRWALSAVTLALASAAACVSLDIHREAGACAGPSQVNDLATRLSADQPREGVT
jgi:peptidoglycan/LPS O-acetylase OafA/YrhL